MTAPPQASRDSGTFDPGPQRPPAGIGQAEAADPRGPLPLAPDWRRWRVPLALIGLIVIGGVVIALISSLTAPRTSNPYLDPANSQLVGGHALADILSERGSTVVRVYAPSSALAALGRASGRDLRTSEGTTSGGPRATLLITSPSLLTVRQLERLGRARADLFLVGPGRNALAVLAPDVELAASGMHYGQLLQPRCDLAAARLAGSANVGGFAYRPPTGALGCYPRHGGPSVVRLTSAGRTVTIIGSGAALTNVMLGSNGNAALVLNLLGSHRSVVWLTPEPSASHRVSALGGPPSANSSASPTLIPWSAWLVVIELGVAVVLAALWRSRRLGPLIAERLPVVVRASETVEGHARMYRSRRARGTAAAALRDAMLSRVLPVVGLNRDATQDAVTDAIAARSRLKRQEIAEIVYGESPATDAELVRLARSLDELERQVRQQ